MNLSELKTRYRLLPVWLRMLMALAVVALVGLFLALDDLERLENRISGGQVDLDSVQSKLEKERIKRDRIPELEAQIIFIRQQMKESRKRLPDRFRVEHVLDSTARIAKETGTNLRLFDPRDPRPGEGSFRYVEMPIHIEVAGRYGEVARFFDRLANLELMIHIRNIAIKPLSSGGESDKATDATRSTKAVSSPESAKKNRRDLRLLASAEVMVYRAMSSDEDRGNDQNNSVSSVEQPKGRSSRKAGAIAGRNQIEKGL